MEPMDDKFLTAYRLFLSLIRPQMTRLSGEISTFSLFITSAHTNLKLQLSQLRLCQLFFLTKIGWNTPLLSKREYPLLSFAQ